MENLNTVIFRFRDFDYPTIETHNQIIKEKGYVWWAWWKKKDESDKKDIISSCIEIIKANGTLEFYLYDSSSDKFYKAIATEFFWDDGTVLRSPEADKTPEYYNQQEFPLWIKLVHEIISDDINFSSLTNGEETLFPVLDDSDVSKEVTQKSKRTLKGNTIFHLSDIHFGSEFAYDNYTYLTDVIKNDPDIDDLGLIIISGDITTKGNAYVLMSEGKDFLNNLVSELKINCNDIIIVPGNHDFPLDQHVQETNSHRSVYISLLKDFYQNEDVQITGLEEFQLPNGKEITILKIDSVRLRSNEDSNFGYVEWNLYRNLLREYSKSSNPEAIKIAVLHHHLTPATLEEYIDPDYSHASISCTLDAGKTIEGLQKNNFKIVLHGHQHVPCITKLSRGRKEGDTLLEGMEDDLFVIAAGSFGSKRMDKSMMYNSYSKLKFVDDKAELTFMEFNTSFGPRPHAKVEFKI